MALIIEDGSGVTGANSFVDSVYADAYFLARSIPAWTGDVSTKEAAIVRSGQYLNGLNWLGSRVNFRAFMCWPRYAVPVADFIAMADMHGVEGWGMYWPSNEVPDVIKYAQCEAALRYLVGTDMLPDLARGGLVLNEKVDVLSNTYASFAPAGTTFQSVMALLRPFLKSSNSVEMVRG